MKPNSRGLSRFIYFNMYDYVRRVSPHVVIGAATRLGKPIGQYFVLCKAEQADTLGLPSASASA